MPFFNYQNDVQASFILTVCHSLLLAVPGSGKTTVLVTRLGYMLLCQGIDPRNILTLTYTIAATKDMKQRYEKIFGEGAGKSENFIFRLITDEKETSRILADILSKLLSKLDKKMAG